MTSATRKVWVGAVAICAGWLGACGEPIVPHSPPALYNLAQEQLANGQFSPALDTLAQVADEAPESELGGRARVLRAALLGGLARACQQIGESYMAGSKAAGEAEHAPAMRTTAMDYFGRARGYSLEMIEALDRLRKSPPADPLSLAFSLPAGAQEQSDTLARVRQGQALPDKERLQAEEARVFQGVKKTLVQMAGTRGDLDQVFLADFYLGAGRALLDLSRIYGPEALRTPRMIRLYQRRALALAEEAGEVAAAAGNERIKAESRELQQYCRNALK